MSQLITVAIMTEAEARSHVEKIKDHVGQIRVLVLDLYEREGWKSLGYKSWRECVVVEFEESQSHLYRLLEAAKIERNISPIGETSIPESHLRVLGDLEPSEQAKVYQEAAATALNSKVTAKHIRAVVKERAVENESDRQSRVKTEQEVRNAIADVVQRLQERFITEVEILGHGKKQGGKITFRYYNDGDLNRILGLLGVDTL